MQFKIFSSFQWCFALVLIWYHRGVAPPSPLLLHNHKSHLIISLLLSLFFVPFFHHLCNFVSWEFFRAPLMVMLQHINQMKISTPTKVVKMIPLLHISCIWMQIQLLCYIFHYWILETIIHGPYPWWWLYATRTNSTSSTVPYQDHQVKIVNPLLGIDAIWWSCHGWIFNGPWYISEYLMDGNFFKHMKGAKKRFYHGDVFKISNLQ